jgi:uncharacterized protein (UPF0548 family)
MHFANQFRLLAHKPSEKEIRSFISAQRRLPFSYGPEGITRKLPDSGHNIDHNRVRLGSGPEAFLAAKLAVQRWKMFDLGWLHLFWNNTPIETGSAVAILGKHLGLWSLNACRIVYVVEEVDSVERYGFAYGTLPGHAVRGEERFTVEWDRISNAVYYDILAVSRPGLLAKVSYPYSRRLQRRFANDSKNAMVRAVREVST